jgi:two-component system, NarL family, response regulator YdfI
MIEVVIMAPQQARRDWLERVLRAEPAFHIAGTAATFPFLRSLMDQTIIDAGIVDLVSIAESEILHDWLSELLEILPLVVLGSVPDSWIFNNVLRAEQGAFLRADAPAEQILNAIHAASVGLIALDGSLVPEPEAAEELPEELTPRETDVLRLLAEGFGNREIANRLNISEHTIKFHIRSILGKLRASTRTEAVTRGLRAGLIEL